MRNTVDKRCREN